NGDVSFGVHRLPAGQPPAAPPKSSHVWPPNACTGGFVTAMSGAVQLPAVGGMGAKAILARAGKEVGVGHSALLNVIFARYPPQASVAPPVTCEFPSVHEGDTVRFG